MIDRKRTRKTKKTKVFSRRMKKIFLKNLNNNVQKRGQEKLRLEKICFKKTGKQQLAEEK